MEFNGKQVFTLGNFKFIKENIGALVTEDVVENLCDWPFLTDKDTIFQSEEPAEYIFDEKYKDARSVFETFTKAADGIWKYHGRCFFGELKERGKRFREF